MKRKDNGELEIRSGIPIPPKQLGTKWPIRSPVTIALFKMVTGDCIDVPILPGANVNTLRARVNASAKTAKSKIIIRRLTENGKDVLRVWKLKQLP
jgi:hypothetical protein